MEIINLNLIPGKAWPVCHASQFDTGREIRVNLFEGAAVYVLSGDEVVDVIIKKPDGNQVTETLTNTADSYVVIVTTEQMTACEGANLGEVRITKGAQVIGSLNFILECEKSPDTGIESHSEIYNLESQVAAIVADQYAAEDVVFDNTPTAGHGVGFAVTSEGVLNAIPDELNDLGDVDINSAAVGEALVWNGAEWVNGTVSTVGSIDDLNDVDTTGKANADSLRYNATAQEWEAKPTTVEMDLAEYTALGGDYSGYENTNIIITDAPNLNETAKDISYDGGADSIWDKVEGKVANVAFDSSTMFADISTAVKNAFNLSECYCYVLKNGNVCTVTLRFKCANAIASGSFNITGLTPCQTDVASALASLDNKGGYMQLSGTVLYIRCSASSSQYLAGSITYPTYTN